MVETICFWGLAALAVISALAVVIMRKPADSVMALLVCMMAIAGLFALMGAYLAALFQVMIYIGAVLVLFIFVVMLLNIRGTESFKSLLPRPLVSAGAGIAILGGIVWISWKTLMVSGLFRMPERVLHPGPRVTEISMELFGRHILVFELTSVLLLAAAVGAVYLTRKEKNKS